MYLKTRLKLLRCTFYYFEIYILSKIIAQNFKANNSACLNSLLSSFLTSALDHTTKQENSLQQNTVIRKTKSLPRIAFKIDYTVYVLHMRCLFCGLTGEEFFTFWLSCLPKACFCELQSPTF